MEGSVAFVQFGVYSKFPSIGQLHVKCSNSIVSHTSPSALTTRRGLWSTVLYVRQRLSILSIRKLRLVCGVIVFSRWLHGFGSQGDAYSKLGTVQNISRLGLQLILVSVACTKAKGEAIVRASNSTWGVWITLCRVLRLSCYSQCV